MRQLRDYIEMQQFTGMSDIEIITSYFIDNDIEEEAMELSHKLAKAKIENVNGEVTGQRLEWAKANFPTMKTPDVYFMPCVDLLAGRGIKFKEGNNETT